MPKRTSKKTVETGYQVQEKRWGRWVEVPIVNPSFRRVKHITKVQNRGNLEHAAVFRAVRITTEVL